VTTLVAIQGPSWAVVACDSRVTEEHGRTFTLAKGFTKIAKNKKYLLGAAGDVRAINILAHSFRPPDAQQFVGARLDRFITSDFVPALRACFEAQGYASQRDQETGSAESGSMVLTVVNGFVYVIGEDYSWVRDVAGIYGLGSGSDFAVGALHALLPAGATDIDQAKVAIRTALGVATQLDANTAAPFIVQVQYAP